MLLEVYQYLTIKYGRSFADWYFDLSFEFWSTCGNPKMHKYSAYNKIL